jgi:predicted metal-dependent hydrolase
VAVSCPDSPRERCARSPDWSRRCEPQNEEHERGHCTIAPRSVSFDWEKTPLHWIPDEPTASHVISALHLLLSTGERWFVKVFKDGLLLTTRGRRPHRAVSHPRTPDGSWAWRSPPPFHACGRGDATFVIRHDLELAGRLRFSLAAHNRAVHKGLLPTSKELGAAVPSYLRRSYHPSQEGSLRRSVEYLVKSPAARTGAGACARAASA